MINDLLILGVIFGSFYLIIKILETKGIRFSEKFPILALAYLISTFLSGKIFFYRIKFFFTNPNYLPFIVLILTIVFGYILKNIAVKKYPVSKKFIKKNPKLLFLKMDDKYLITNFFNVMFQQLAILTLISVFISNNLSIKIQILYFVLIFGLLHFYIIFEKGIIGLMYIGVSLLLGFLFIILITSFDYGFVYSISLHWITYVFGRILFGIVKPG